MPGISSTRLFAIRILKLCGKRHRALCFILSLGAFILFTMLVKRLLEPDPLGPKRVKFKDDKCEIRDPDQFLLRPHPPNSPLPTVCAREDCKLAYLKRLQRSKSYPVPKIRHILWRNELAPNSYIEHLRSWYKFHPDWTFVLWRDEELEPFVALNFPGLLPLFQLMPHHMMRVDMIRYLLLCKYGGTYADFDYSLARSLNEFRRFPAVVTREPEAHSLHILGLNYPVPILANPAFMMSAPQHPFFLFALHQLLARRAKEDVLQFAGPIGLTEMLETYNCVFQIAQDLGETVYVPPSYSFHPYAGNRLSSSPVAYVKQRLRELTTYCQRIMRANKLPSSLTTYCQNVDDMNPITDNSHPVYAVHDRYKLYSTYDSFSLRPTRSKTSNVTRIFKNLFLGKDFMKLF